MDQSWLERFQIWRQLPKKICGDLDLCGRDYFNVQSFYDDQSVQILRIKHCFGILDNFGIQIVKTGIMILEFHCSASSD